MERHYNEIGQEVRSDKTEFIRHPQQLFVDPTITTKCNNQLRVQEQGMLGRLGERTLNDGTSTHEA